MATITCEGTRPQMATVRGNVFKKIREDGAAGEVVPLGADLSGVPCRMRRLAAVKEGGEDVDLAGAKTIVSGGRGRAAARGGWRVRGRGAEQDRNGGA